jgi:hypothetical protein
MQAAPLIVWPTFVSSLLSPEYQQVGSQCQIPCAYASPMGNFPGAANILSEVEIYYARSLGFSQVATGLMLMVLSGALPMASGLDCAPLRSLLLHEESVLTICSERYRFPIRQRRHPDLSSLSRDFGLLQLHEILPHRANGVCARLRRK